MNNRLLKLVKPLFYKKLSCIASLSFAVLFNFTSFTTYAVTIDNLMADKQLTLTTSIKQSEQQIVGQPLVIIIEVATQRWFAKGTKVNEFELADVVILANSEVSFNGTRRVNNETWSTQTKEITIYPKREGNFVIPAIEVQVSINTEKHGIVDGVIVTTPQHVDVLLPKALENIEHYIVSSNVEVDVSTNTPEKKSYTRGEALSVNVQITSAQSPAMMIPPLKIPQIEGISIYQKTPQVFDKSNRGELIGTRTESITYIFEQFGQYTIPQQIIYWWNTNTNDLEEVIIPELVFNVGNHTSNTNKNKEPIDYNVKEIIYLIGITFIIVSLLLAFKHYKERLFSLYATVTHLTQRTTKNALLNAVKAKNYIEAVEHFHHYLQISNISREQFHSNQAIALNKIAFNIKDEIDNFTIEDAKILLKEVKSSKKHVKQKVTLNEVLKLNNE